MEKEDSPSVATVPDETMGGESTWLSWGKGRGALFPHPPCDTLKGLMGNFFFFLCFQKQNTLPRGLLVDPSPRDPLGQNAVDTVMRNSRRTTRPFSLNAFIN